MKSTSRNRFFLCFRPVPIDGVLESERGCPDDTLGDEGGIARIKSSGSHNDFSSPFLGKCTFLRTFKVMLRRSAGGTKCSCRCPCRSGTYGPYKTKHPSSNLGLGVRVGSIDHNDGKKVMSNNSTSMSTCLATSSFPSETSRPLYVKEKDVREHPCEHIYNMYLLLISLAMTIFGGRVCGIFFTSFWMYMSFRRRLDGMSGGQKIKGRQLIEDRVGSEMTSLSEL